MTKHTQTLILFFLTTILICLSIGFVAALILRKDKIVEPAEQIVIEAPVSGEVSDKIGEVFPALELTDMADITKTITLPQNDGFMLVNLFASWCKPCLQEWPHLKTLSENKSLKLFGIGLADDQGMEEFLQRNGNPFNQIGLDIKGEVLTVLRAPGLPVTYLLDDEGVVRFYRVGPLLDRDIEAIRTLTESN